MQKMLKGLVKDLEYNSPKLYSHFNPLTYPIYSRYYEQFLDGTESSFFLLFMDYFQHKRFNISKSDIELFIINGCQLDYTCIITDGITKNTFIRLIEISHNQLGLGLLEFALQTNSVKLTLPVQGTKVKYLNYIDYLNDQWWIGEDVEFLIHYYAGVEYLLKKQYSLAYHEFDEATYNDAYMAGKFTVYEEKLKYYCLYARNRRSIC